MTSAKRISAATAIVEWLARPRKPNANIDRSRCIDLVIGSRGTSGKAASHASVACNRTLPSDRSYSRKTGLQPLKIFRFPPRRGRSRRADEAAIQACACWPTTERANCDNCDTTSEEWSERAPSPNPDDGNADDMCCENNASR